MLYVVTYDIVDNRTRKRISDYLELKGRRVQESVFECRLAAGQADDLARELDKLLDKAKGNIRIYQVCSDCLSMSLGVGTVEKIEPDKGYHIF